jgi:hypothetical protein
MPSYFTRSTPQALAPVSLPPWLLRLWQAQAAQRYRSPEAQRLALLHRLRIRCQLAPTSQAARWGEALSARLREEVSHG